MANPIFYILDVFAEEKYAGNPLAVVRHAGHWTKDQMQKLAQEMTYSETTFIVEEKIHDGGFDVRIFTPGAEMPFAGHPTLGTAFIIQNEILDRPADQVILNLKVGQIPVTFGSDGVLWMRQMPPVFGEIFDPRAIASSLSLRLDDIDTRYPIQDVSTGFPCIITPLKTLDALKRARVKHNEFFNLVERHNAKEILLFTPEAHKPENDLSVRFFADFLGVPEDPATGSANGCLAGYLVKHRYFGKDNIDLRVGQGYEMGRPSLLLLRADEIDGKIVVSVGGRVIMTAKGELV